MIELGLVAWDKAAAVDLLAALAGTTVALLGVAVCRVEPWGVVPIGEEWCCVSQPGEMATDFADRSQTEALAYIEAHDESVGALYALEFSAQDDAA